MGDDYYCLESAGHVMISLWSLIDVYIYISPWLPRLRFWLLAHLNNLNRKPTPEKCKLQNMDFY